MNLWDEKRGQDVELPRIAEKHSSFTDWLPWILVVVAILAGMAVIYDVSLDDIRGVIAQEVPSVAQGDSSKGLVASIRRDYPGVKFDVFRYAHWSGATPNVYVEVAPKHEEFGTGISRFNNSTGMRIASPPNDMPRWEVLEISPSADRETLTEALREKAARAQEQYDEHMQGEREADSAEQRVLELLGGRR